MEKYLAIFPLALLLCFTFGCQKTEEAAEEPVVDIEAEKQDVEAVVRNYHEAAASHNYQGIRDICTDDFILFQSGEVMNLEDVINYITRSEGSTMTFNLEDVKINVEGPVSWIRLRSKAKMTMEGQVMDLEWLESAVLKKQEGIWKIAFCHSTDATPTVVE